MKVINKYWDSDLCLTKIKIKDKFKTLAFDQKNRRLSIVSHDRNIYFIDLPDQQSRYIEQAEVRFF
jgi:hypothetical protein